MTKNNNSRIWEVDALRGIAILLMIAFHVAFDLSYFYQWNIDLEHGFWLLMGRVAAILFIASAGMTSVILKKRKAKLLQKNLKRSIRIFGYAMLITLGSYLIFPELSIFFGILHFIAVGIILSTPLISYKKLSFLVGTGIIASSLLLKGLTVKSLLWIPLGLTPPDFQTLDYYPLIPWLGVMLLGITAGHILLEKRVAQTKNPCQRLTKIGKHSLAIYLFHQPIILGFMWLIFR